MATSTVIQLPARVDLRVYSGDLFKMIVTVRQAGQPLDVSAETFAASMDDGNQFDVDMTDAAQGKVGLSIHPKLGARRWDLEMTSAERTLAAGDVCVVEDVTRPVVP